MVPIFDIKCSENKDSFTIKQQEVDTDQNTNSLVEFFTHFSQNYSDLAQEIFFVNSDQGLQKLENFNSKS